MSALDGVIAKLGRAEEHRRIAREIDKVFAQKECRIEPKFNPKTDSHDFIARLPSPPTELSLILGDAFHNIRTALDHLVWGLVEANPNRPPNTPGTFTMFPICDTRQGYREQVAKRRILGAVSEAAALIDGAQPYHRREAGRDHTLHPLWVLNALENIDKHRRLTLTATVGLTRRGDDTRYLVDGNVTAVVPHPETFRDGAVVASFPAPTDTNRKVRVQGQITAAVVFDERSVFSSDSNAFAVFDTVLDYTNSLVADLARYLR